MMAGGGGSGSGGGRRLLLAAAFLVLARCVAPTAALRPFAQTPEFVSSVFQASLSVASADEASWRSIGPDRTSPQWAKSIDASWWIDAGRVQGFLQDPDNPNTVYALFGGGGLWKTANFFEHEPGATRWRPLTDQLPANGGAVSFGKDGRVIYYASGDIMDSLNPDGRAQSVGTVSGVLVRSTNGGDSWGTPRLIHPDVSIVYDLDVIPHPGGAVDKDIVIAATDVGLMVSRDGGATFTRKLPAGGARPNPFNQSSDAFSVVRTKAGWIAAARLAYDQPTQIFRSRDGIDWAPAGFTFPNKGGRVTLVTALKNDPAESVVLADVAMGRGGQSENGPISPIFDRSWLDVFSSDDGGLTFTPTGALSPDKTFAAPAAVAGRKVLDCVGGQAGYNMALLLDPNDPSRQTWLWAGALASMKTTDNGESLTVTSVWYPGADPQCWPQGMNYMHADAHAAIALRRPAGWAPKPVVGIAASGTFKRGMGAALPQEMEGAEGGEEEEEEREREREGRAGTAAERKDEKEKEKEKDKDKEKDDKDKDKPKPKPRPRPSPVPPAQRKWDILFGTDGGLSFSTNGGLSWDNGQKNIGISTFLITHVKGTPLNRDLVVIGVQDNGSRLRMKNTTAWEEVQGGDGQAQLLSQAGDPAKGGYVCVTNWYSNLDGYSYAALDEAARKVNGSRMSQGYFQPQGIPTQDIPSSYRGLDGTFGTPTAAQDPTGQVFFTRVQAGLFRSADAGRSWALVRSFPPPVKVQQEEQPIVYALYRAARLHNIGVAPGASRGTLAVAVIRPVGINAWLTNTVDVTLAQGEAANATWFNAGALNQVADWVDDRLEGRATTTSPVFDGRGRLYVASVALPTPGLRPQRPRLAWTSVSAAGASPFVACASHGLPDTPVQRILVDPDESERIYAATWVGVYVSEDRCHTFKRLGRALPNVQVRDLDLLPAGGTGEPKLLRAATFGRSIWELPLGPARSVRSAAAGAPKAAGVRAAAAAPRPAKAAARGAPPKPAAGAPKATGG